MKPIVPGDLVAVVRGHGCDIGTVFVVRDVYPLKGGWVCTKCMTRESGHNEPWATWNTKGQGVLVKWLQRIDPKTITAQMRMARREREEV